MLNKMIRFNDGIYKNLVGYVTEINGGIATVYLIHEDREVKEIMVYMELVIYHPLFHANRYWIKQVENETFHYDLYYLNDIEAYAILKYAHPHGKLLEDETLFLKADINAVEVLEELIHV